MKKTKLLVMFGISALSIASFSFKKQNGFKIQGSVSGFADSTHIFLNNITTGSFQNMDSTYIVGGKFHFEGTLHESAVNVAIRTKDFADRSYLWLENSDITFAAEKGKFKEAVVHGSETNDASMRLNAAIKNAGNERLLNVRFIQDHPGSIISSYILSAYCSTWGKDTLAMLYKNFSRDVKNSYYGRNILNFITLNKNPKVGEHFVDFAQADITGKEVKLSEVKGKVVLLDFWASWCGPCMKENPELVKIYNTYKDRGFEVFGVSVDDNKQAWINAINKDSLPWRNVSDLNGDKNKAVLIYGVSHFPDNFLIDKNGVIIARDIRGDALKARLKEIFE